MATRNLGAAHTITATARDTAGRPIAGVAIHFSVLGPANRRPEQVVTTNAAGVALLAYTGTNAGRDTISAYADSNGNGRQDATEPSTLAAVDYVDATAADVQLAQNAGSSLRGSATVVTATVRTASGAPTPDARVVFIVTGANARPAQAVLANAAGQAVFNYTGANPGTDVIRAFVDLNGNNQRDAGEPEQTISHVYTAPVAAAVTLLPQSGVAPRGSVHLLHANVRDAAGAPVAGVTVRFVVTGANPRSDTATSDASGNATFQHIGANAGTDTIVAFADLNNNAVHDANEPQGQATRTFVVIQVPPQTTSVPDLSELVRTAATAAITASGLTLGTVQTLPSPPRPIGPGSPLHPILGAAIVVDQSPAANAVVPRGTKVNLKLQQQWLEGRD